MKHVNRSAEQFGHILIKNPHALKLQKFTAISANPRRDRMSPRRINNAEPSCGSCGIHRNSLLQQYILRCPLSPTVRLRNHSVGCQGTTPSLINLGRRQRKISKLNCWFADQTKNWGGQPPETFSFAGHGSQFKEAVFNSLLWLVFIDSSLKLACLIVMLELKGTLKYLLRGVTI